MAMAQPKSFYALALAGPIGGVVGGVLVFILTRRKDDGVKSVNEAEEITESKANLTRTSARDFLPHRIILLRHGESEGNADNVDIIYIYIYF